MFCTKKKYTWGARHRSRGSNMWLAEAFFILAGMARQSFFCFLLLCLYPLCYSFRNKMILTSILWGFVAVCVVL